MWFKKHILQTKCSFNSPPSKRFCKQRPKTHIPFKTHKASISIYLYIPLTSWRRENYTRIEFIRRKWHVYTTMLANLTFVFNFLKKTVLSDQHPHILDTLSTPNPQLDMHHTRNPQLEFCDDFRTFTLCLNWSIICDVSYRSFHSTKNILKIDKKKH